MIEPWIFAVTFTIAAVFGLRGSIRVTRRYLAVRDQLVMRESLILALLTFICWVITLAAFWYGVLSARTVLGFERIEGTAFVSVILATLILFVPTVIDAVVDRVARVPWS